MSAEARKRGKMTQWAPRMIEHARLLDPRAGRILVDVGGDARAMHGTHHLQRDGDRQQDTVEDVARAQMHHDASVRGYGIAGRKRELPCDGLSGKPGAAGTEDDLAAKGMGYPQRSSNAHRYDVVRANQSPVHI